MKAAIFPCIGLGDGLITLVLSHNLARNGWEVDTFHPFMSQMQELFPRLPLLPRPAELPLLASYDKIIILYEKTEWMLTLLQTALALYPEKTLVLNPIATPNQDYPFWEVGRFDGRVPFVDNLFHFCRNVLQLKEVVKENGICLPPTVEKGKFPQRVLLHPTSSRKGKNWSKQKFLRLSTQLKKKGLHPVFILTKEEKEEWPEVEAPHFPDLKALTHFVAESGSMIGNDSGIGHLASCLGVPTLIICRSATTADFWRPAWAKGEVIFPPHWIPNIKGLRWRDKKWQHFIPVRQVLKTFSLISHT